MDLVAVDVLIFVFCIISVVDATVPDSFFVRNEVILSIIPFLLMLLSVTDLFKSPTFFYFGIRMLTFTIFNDYWIFFVILPL